MRRAILILGLMGAGVFAGALFLSFAEPLLVERAARELVRKEVEQRVGEAIDRLSDSRIAVFAQHALGRTDDEIADTRRGLRDSLPAATADVTTRMLDPACPCRAGLARLAREAGEARISSLADARGRLAGLIEARYATVSRSLLREFRIFTGSNAIAFGLLALVAFARGRARLQLLLPSIAIVGAIALAGGLYLFNQDWLHAIVFGDYVGWGYTAHLTLVALLLTDILVNHARVTTRIVNVALNIAGAAASAVPC